MNGGGEIWTEEERPRLRLHEVLTETASAFPDNEAVVMRDERVSFAELDHRTRSLADQLVDAGAGPGARIAVSTAGDPVGITVLYAISAAGAVVLPLNPYWTKRETTDAIERGEATHLLVARGLNIAAEAVLEAVAECSEDRVPRIGIVSSDGVSWEEGVAPQSAPLDPSVATIMFTSGSTGRPKAALQPHFALVGAAHFYRRALRLGPTDRYLLLLPIYHTGGIVDGLLASHLAGTTVVILPDFDPVEVLETYEKERITVTTAFESMLHKVEATDGYSPERHKWLKKAGIAGVARTHDRLLEAGVELIIPSYAMTETCSGTSIARPMTPDAERRGTNGEPVPGVDVRIVDSETGKELPPDEQGEIQVKGWTLFAGYLEDRGLDEDGWLHSGDLGRLSPDGILTYEGRIKNMIKSGGENVSEFEVETYLVDHVPGIRQACVIGVPNEEWTEMVVAYLEMFPGADFDADAVRTICRDGLAGYKVPKRYWQIAPGDWPLLASGKIDKVRMRTVAAQRKQEEARN
jgi:acyl-CoA synthetase (AMP-forming)/AMP-acid ligase II